MPLVEVSMGEFVDRWSILHVKSRKLTQVSQLRNIEAELAQVESEINTLKKNSDLLMLVDSLLNCNLEIWDAMDTLYQIHTPNLEYAKLSLEITRLNQQRAFLKKKIDSVVGYKFSEEKSFFEDQTQLVNQTNTGLSTK